MTRFAKISAAAAIALVAGTISASAACNSDASTETVLGAGSGALVGGLASHSIVGAAVGVRGLRRRGNDRLVSAGEHQIFSGDSRTGTASAVENSISRSSLRELPLGTRIVRTIAPSAATRINSVAPWNA